MESGGVIVLMIGIVVVLVVASDCKVYHAVVGADINVIVAVVQILVQMRRRNHIGEIDGRLHALTELVALHVKSKAHTHGVAIRLETDGQRTGVVVDGSPETVGTFGSGIGIVHPAQQGGSDVGAIGEMLADDCGIVFEAKSEQAVYDALKFAFENETKMTEFAQNARQKTQDQYALEKVVAKYKKIWSESSYESV